MDFYDPVFVKRPEKSLRFSWVKVMRVARKYGQLINLQKVVSFLTGTYKTTVLSKVRRHREDFPLFDNLVLPHWSVHIDNVEHIIEKMKFVVAVVFFWTWKNHLEYLS